MAPTMIDMHLSELFSLKGKVVLVTGGRRGIGWEIVRTAAAAGAHVVVNDIVEDDLEDRLDELRSKGFSLSTSVFDVTIHEAAQSAVDGIVRAHGSLDILVNNAGNQNRKAFVDYKPEEWESIQKTHVTGGFNVTQAAARHMTRNGFGRIVMMGSLAVTAFRSTLAPYAAAKGALTSLTKELAYELGPQGITCNAIAPGYIATEFTSSLVNDPDFSGWVNGRVPLGRWGSPQDIAPAVLFLVSPAGRYINGAVLNIDGGILCGL